MITLQPNFKEIPKLAISRHLRRRQMIMKINNRLPRRHLVIKASSKFRLKEKIVVDEWHTEEGHPLHAGTPRIRQERACAPYPPPPLSPFTLTIGFDFHPLPCHFIVGNWHCPPPLSPSIPSHSLMNALGFLMHRLAWQLGLKSERNRWAAVTRETQMLAEAQSSLGRFSWPLMEKVDHTSGEFWVLLDLDNQQRSIRELTEKLNSENERDQEILYTIEDRCEQDIAKIRTEKKTSVEEAQRLTQGMEALKDRDSDTRRRFANLKTKLEVLKKQEGDYTDELEKTRLILQDLKTEHENNLEEISQIDTLVKVIEGTVGRLDEAVAARRRAQTDEATDLVSKIGRRSKQIAEGSAKVGLLENQKNELSFQIGQYLSDNIETRDQNLRQVLKRFRPITNRIKYLKSSILYNQRLVRRSGH